MNQQGSVSYFVLVPSLVMILTIVAAIALLIFTFRKNQRTCRTISLDAQAIQGEALNKILNLNMKARMLRQKETAIKAAMLAGTISPPSLAKLYVALRLVQTSRRALDVQQRSIIYAANIRATQIANSSNTLPRKVIRLRVQPVNKSELAPEYKVDANFEKAQSLNYSYRLSMKDILPGWLLNFFIEVKDLQMKCGATLKKKEDKWLPVLSAAN
ncbi:MAG: hypothetical protein A4S09_12765 [Proteobacteria bacterium SG_bin7]|nr:MAG: hypothetical protein A4S09_12765 [Proteobacteria bacterium SG_bin7]